MNNCSYIVYNKLLQRQYIYFRNLTKHTQAYKLIPIVMAIIGGLLGIIIYLTNPEMILNAENIWIALGVGIVSGASSTGANQIVKQIFKKGENKNE